MAWTINVDGRVFREGDLTIDDAEAMEKATGVNWRQLNPLRSAGVAKGIVRVILEHHCGLSEEDATAKAGALTVDALMDMLGNYDPDEDMPVTYQDGFPPPAGETSTPT